MTVRELIYELEQYDEDMEVVMKPSNSMYVDEIAGSDCEELRAFYGENQEVVVLGSGGQCGAV